jgi:hypothetical protein
MFSVYPFFLADFLNLNGSKVGVFFFWNGATLMVAPEGHGPSFWRIPGQFWACLFADAIPL